MPWTHACDLDEVEMEEAVRVDYAGRSYAVFLTEDGGLFCTQGLCPVDGAHLAGGILDGTLIECPDHGGMFDLRDGAVRGVPDASSLATFAVRETDGRVEADLPD